jgi:hypothetical protein
MDCEIRDATELKLHPNMNRTDGLCLNWSWSPSCTPLKDTECCLLHSSVCSNLILSQHTSFAKHWPALASSFHPLPTPLIYLVIPFYSLSFPLSILSYIFLTYSVLSLHFIPIKLPVIFALALIWALSLPRLCMSELTSPPLGKAGVCLHSPIGSFASLDPHLLPHWSSHCCTLSNQFSYLYPTLPSWLTHCPDRVGSMHLWSVSLLLKDYTVPYPSYFWII